MNARRKSAGAILVTLLVASAWLATSASGQAIDAAAQRATGVEAALALAADRAGDRHWVFDPAAPGEDLPPRGRSLFDFLVMQERRGSSARSGQPTIPFPFAALLQYVQSETRSDPRSNAAAVLIPLGRSLQRASAAPDFFVYPRAVFAVDAEPAAGSDLYLKDRLYIGYQEKAGLLEVISYNEDAGRFEFQIVTDYRAGGVPRIAYANRALCIACHQNGAPIFSRPAWDETNANPRVAALLRAERNDFYGIPVDRGVDVPNALDNAVLRANQLAIQQLLWRDGCGAVDEAAVRCRAGLFAAVLRYRLSGQQQFDRTETSFRNDVMAKVMETARLRWPHGVAVGNPDLPNRNPLPDDSAAAAIRNAGSLLHVAVAFDPLEPRPPLEVWDFAGASEVARGVGGLAGFLAEQDVERIDRALSKAAAKGAAQRRMMTGRCNVRAAASDGGARRIEFGCASPSGSDSPFSVEGRLIVAGNSISRGAIDRLEANGWPALREIDLSGTRIDARGAERMAVLAPRTGHLHARGADGNAFERVELRWGGREATIRIVVLDDFAPVRKAIEAMVQESLARRFDGFDALAFRRARLIPTLLAALDDLRGNMCCTDASGMPPARASRDEIPSSLRSDGPTASAPAAHASFYRYCAECHLGVERTPPNFLLGDADAVEAKLRQCAPRIYARLSMWRQAKDARTKTPMPPEIAIGRLHVSPAAWRDGDVLAGLLRSTRERLRWHDDGEQNAETLLGKSYESLPPCLPEPAAASRTATAQR